MSKKPILIVNADDFGYDDHACETTLRAFEKGRITSATAMVHMLGSARAAELGSAAGLPTGLHINLTEAYSDPVTPADVRARHERARAHFAGGGLRRRSWTKNAAVRRDVEATVADQLAAFERSFGGPPTHLDGHNHVHVCPDVALAAALRPIRRRRDAIWSWPSAISPMALARAARRRLTYRGLLTTRRFYDIHELVGDGQPSVDDALGAVNRGAVEVMCHPRFDHELEVLSSTDWDAAMAATATGSFADLD